MFYRTFRLAALAAVVSTGLFLPARSNAGVITSGCVGATSCTFLELLTGGSIQAGDLVFSGFSNFANQGITTKLPDLTQIIVTGVDDGGLDPGPGLVFSLNGQFSVTAGQGMDLLTTFLVGPASSGSNQIKDSSITLQSVMAQGTNSASGVEQVLFEYNGGPEIYTHVVDVRPSESVNILMSSTTFPARDSVYNTLTLRVFPGSDTAGLASLDLFEIRFSQQEGGILPPTIPEPGSLSLMGAGLLFAAALARRRKTVS